MSAVVLENAPSTFVKRFWNKINFNDILWIYWDWMDWVQYGEVIPDEEDIKASINYKKDISRNNSKDFLDNLP